MLNDPEPLALVDSLGSATVNLRIYFWINGEEYGYFKVKSAIIRLTKLAFEDAGISMPDEAREMNIFPAAFQLNWWVNMNSEYYQQVPPAPHNLPLNLNLLLHQQKQKLTLPAKQKRVKEQARESWQPGDGENLLQGSTDNDIP